MEVAWNPGQKTHLYVTLGRACEGVDDNLEDV